MIRAFECVHKINQDSSFIPLISHAVVPFFNYRRNLKPESSTVTESVPHLSGLVVLVSIVSSCAEVEDAVTSQGESPGTVKLWLEILVWGLS